MPDETTTSVNAEQVSDEGSQVEQVETVESVNAEESEVTTTETEKPVQTPEENAKFAEQRRAREQAEQRAEQLERDYSISRKYGAEYDVHSEAEIAETFGHLGIKTEADLVEAIRIKKMKDDGVDPDAVDRHVNEHPDVKAAREWREQQTLEQQKQADAIEFFDYFQQVNGRVFDPKTDILPPEVWAENQKGTPLKVAYAMHENANLKAKIKAYETNQTNAQGSTGSLTGNGNGQSATLTPEIIDAMTDKERMARWPEIKKVLGMK